MRRRLRRDRRLADPERAPQHGGRRDVGQRPPRRRRRHRQLDPRRHGRASPTAPPTPRSGSSACSRPTRATGVLRHLDAGYDEARLAAAERRPRAADARRDGAGLRDALRGGCSSATSRSSSRPAGTAAPLRGRELGARRPGRRRVRPGRGRPHRRPSGAMRDLPPLAGDVDELDGRGRCAVPGLVDCHTHPASPATASRSSRFAPAAPTTRSCTPPAAGSSRPFARRARPARRGSCARGRAAPRLDARGTARRRGRRSRATASTARPSSRPCARSARRAACRPGSARTRSRRSSPTPTRTSTSRSPTCSRRRRELAEAADVFLERGAFDAAQARRYLEACRGGRPRAAPPRRPVHGGGRRPARDRARRAVGRPPRGDRRGRRRARSRRAT